jgi:DNA-binding NarL/FixJ family response regulator
MSDLSIQPLEKGPIRVAILNGSALICKGLEFVLQAMTGIQIVGSALNTEDSMALIRKTHPELVITDVTTPSLDGIAITRFVKEEFPNVKVLILTAVSDVDQIFDALWSGADGYCLNDVSSEKVRNAIQSVLAGGIWLDSSIAPSIKKGASELRDANTNRQENSVVTPVPDFSGLTDREISVLELVSMGFSNIRIASELSISSETVKTHIRHIMKKLAVTDRTQAAVVALKRRIVQ